LFRKGLFIFAHQIGDPRFNSTYKKLVKNQWKSYPELKADQDSQLRTMIEYAYTNVPYYHRVFRELNIKPDDIKGISDLERLPILTKEIIKQNWDEFIPLNINKTRYYSQATGGSTGTPLKYRLDKFDRFLGGALMYRGWGYGGYKLGDKMVFLAGLSLNVGTKAHEISRNIKKLSSYDMGEEDMRSYVKIINLLNPRFIRGQAYSIYFFSKWIKDNDLSIQNPLSVFTTAEMLYPHMREMIEDVFNCKVYDGYGLNDGGISAYECPEHSGLHIDTERSVMEVVNQDGHQMNDGEGQILATSLHNYAMPFIRYDTGDLGHIISENCNCGRGYRLLKRVTGRQLEMLMTPEGKYIHGFFFNHILKEINGVKEFQVLQKTLNKIVIKIVPEDDFDDKLLDQINKQLVPIRELIGRKSEAWEVEFKIVEKIERTRGGKFRYVINEMKK